MKRENVEAIIFEHLQIQISSFWSKEGFVPILHMWHSRSWHEQYNLSMMIHRIYLTHSGRDVFLDWEELGGSKEKVKFQSASNTFSPEEIFLNYNLITFYIYIHSQLIMQKWCCTWNDAYGHTRWRDELCKAVNHFLCLSAFLDISFFYPMYSRLWNVSSLTWPSLPREFYLKPEKNVHVSVDQIKT